MIVGAGVDLTEVDRMQRVLDSAHGARFLARVFTVAERRYCNGRKAARAESFAARFAAKEAVMKALGVGWGADASWLEIEVARGPKGAPTVVLRGAAQATANQLTSSAPACCIRIRAASRNILPAAPVVPVVLAAPAGAAGAAWAGSDAARREAGLNVRSRPAARLAGTRSRCGISRFIENKTWAAAGAALIGHRNSPLIS